MPSAIDTLQRDVRQYREIAINGYDSDEASEQDLQQLTFQIDNRKARENPVNISTYFALPVAYEWGDQVQILTQLDQVEWTVPIKGYSAAVPYNEVNIGRPAVVAGLQSVVASLGPAMRRKQVQKTFFTFRRNPVCYDGQTFFSDQHTHPTGEQYSNVLNLVDHFTDVNDPQPLELMDFLDVAIDQLQVNQRMMSEVSRDTDDQGLLVIARDRKWKKALSKVRRRSVLIDSTGKAFENTSAGTFDLLEDYRDSGGDDKVVIVDSRGNFPPVFFVIDTDPKLDAWEENRFKDGHVAVGLKQQFGQKPGLPQGTLVGRNIVAAAPKTATKKK